MKYQNIRAFQKHLESAAPDHLCRFYLAAVPDDYERSSAVSSILACFDKQSRVRLSGASASVREIADALLSPSLFGGEPLVILEDADKMGKKETDSLHDLVQSARAFGVLIASAKGKTALAPAFEKAGVVLDLTGEKPWEREKRLSTQAAERAASKGKRIAPDALLLLLERIGPDAALLDSEVDKLSCFVGERPTIERSDVYRISASREKQLWQTAEGIVWEGECSPLDDSLFHALVPALRSQLQTGLKLAHFSFFGTPREEWGSHLPRMWPKLIEKRSYQAKELGGKYFQRGLDLLFEIELLSRSGSGREGALLDLFRFSLQYAKR